MRKPTIQAQQKMLEAGNFGSRKQRNFTTSVTKTKALIRFAVTAKLIRFCLCKMFVFSRCGPNTSEMLMIMSFMFVCHY